MRVHPFPQSQRQCYQ